MQDFKCGDKVVVTDHGKQFDIYKGWASAFHLSNFKDGYSIGNGVKGCVVAKGPHLAAKDWMIYGVRLESGYEIIMCGKGLKLDDEQPCNGVDAKGSSLNFVKEMLQPFMRVQCANGNMCIVTPNIQKAYTSFGQCVVVGNNNWSEAYFPNEERSKQPGYEPFAIIKVYAAPMYNYQMLDAEHSGYLIWEYKEQQEQKDERVAHFQLAIDAVNERIAALQEDVKSLQAGIVSGG